MTPLPRTAVDIKSLHAITISCNSRGSLRKGNGCGSNGGVREVNELERDRQKRSKSVISAGLYSGHGKAGKVRILKLASRGNQARGSISA